MTLFETCAMGLPSIAFANEPHEIKTITYFKSLGLCLSIGSIYKTNHDEIEKKCSKFLNDRKRIEKVALTCFGYFNENGLKKCVSAIKDMQK